jgi:hypothetical protein
MRALWLTVLGVLAFAGILVWRLPASWVIPARSAEHTCSEIEGTVWSGSCTGLVIDRQPIGDVTWEAHPLRLLTGRLSAEVALVQPAGNAHGHVEFGLGRRISARDVRADFPLEPALLPQLPTNLHGQVHAEISALEARGHAITVLEGQIVVRDLEQGSGGSEPLGSYQLDFPAASGASPVGKLHDLGGPLEVEGSLRITPEPGFDLQGLIRARASASEELKRDIQYLGSPDEKGRRLFSLAATF